MLLLDVCVCVCICVCIFRQGNLTPFLPEAGGKGEDEGVCVCMYVCVCVCVGVCIPFSEKSMNAFSLFACESCGWVCVCGCVCISLEADVAVEVVSSLGGCLCVEV